jgi:hypothetical protein
MTARYPIEPLAHALNITLNTTGRHHHDTLELAGLSALQERLGLSERQLRRVRALGGWDRATTAERYAIAIGRHPATIWPGWDRDIPDRLTDAAWPADDPPMDTLGDDPPAVRSYLHRIMVA